MTTKIEWIQESTNPRTANTRTNSNTNNINWDDLSLFIFCFVFPIFYACYLGITEVNRLGMVRGIIGAVLIFFAFFLLNMLWLIIMTGDDE